MKKNFEKDFLVKEISYVCGIVFDFSKRNSFFSEKIYLETEVKKNAMYGEVGISRGYQFRIVTGNKPFQFRFYSELADPFYPKTGKEGIEYIINANSLDELKNKVAEKIIEILS